ncbi:DUF1003 domain-containing protein [Pseudoclavibacter sp. CFCC 11306]|uniref:DUF1003 domain-containing protein n=1 Tax=Pseudoclavibacter sp. CFCC 11306 TaxID=1564493 RepID=UPI001300FA0D|nr:DUF1003 domain-containing protein [Pseudoclavibacter sp. CFCC 11306]KAB1656947.1 DUF1003 domain-containing protein [Pseudoclavibacter sp. CFCC 11306]
MAKQPSSDHGLLNAPQARRVRLWKRKDPVEFGSADTFGRFTESFARAMGTPAFLLGMSVFIILWITWNTIGPEDLRFDSAAMGYIALTLVLSLQASYSAPLLLLAQNRQDDRDRVQIEQDRQRAERNLADTEYLAREVVALRLAVSELASERFVRDELREQLEDLTATIQELRGEMTPRQAGEGIASSAAEASVGAHRDGHAATAAPLNQAVDGQAQEQR